MPRNTSGLKVGGPGRKKGQPNNATVEVREFCRKLLSDPAYQAKLVSRLNSGKIAPAVEQMVFAYAFGKPKEQVELTGADGGPIALQTIRRVIVGGGEAE